MRGGETLSPPQESESRLLKESGMLLPLLESTSCSAIPFPRSPSSSALGGLSASVPSDDTR